VVGAHVPFHHPSPSVVVKGDQLATTADDDLQTLAGRQVARVDDQRNVWVCDHIKNDSVPRADQDPESAVFPQEPNGSHGWTRGGEAGCERPGEKSIYVEVTFSHARSLAVGSVRIRRSVRGVAKRDDEHAMEHFAAARELLRYESDRLSNIFSAFLLANTVLMGFLLHAATSSGGLPGEPDTAVAGGLVGLCVCGLWLAAYERIASTLEMRIARARETEPGGWELLTGRPHSFDQGQAVVFDGEDEPRRVKGLARLEIRSAGRLLISVFIVLYATVAVWGLVDAVK
jgi:hypothetical protein